MKIEQIEWIQKNYTGKGELSQVNIAKIGQGILILRISNIDDAKQFQAFLQSHGFNVKMKILREIYEDQA